MPELPEVETIRRGLLPKVMGARIADIVIGDSRVFQTPPPQFQERLVDQCIRGLDRRGKFLILELDRDYCIFHLGMTGQLTFRDPELRDPEGFLSHPVTGLQRTRQHPPDRHTHLQLLFSDGTAVFFRDIRKFGRVELLEKRPELLQEFFGNLGLEPLTADYRLESFLNLFKGRSLRIKSLLLDQSFVAGVGNIYADEALFAAGLHPLRTVRSLRRYEKERLFSSIAAVLAKGIRHGGTTLRDYVDSDGREGSHQEELLVYGRGGEPCLECGAGVVKIVVSQRGTHFCPRCQPRRPAGRSRKGSPDAA